MRVFYRKVNVICYIFLHFFFDFQLVCGNKNRMKMLVYFSTKTTNDALNEYN